ncbi:hypothetical protein Q3G72_012609 [Acer saccharum]|nr:hypothetical protein Q3G72_012609 [Acer saccharum]
MSGTCKRHSPAANFLAKVTAVPPRRPSIASSSSSQPFLRLLMTVEDKDARLKVEDKDVRLKVEDDNDDDGARKVEVDDRRTTA